MHRETCRGHGRIEERSIWATDRIDAGVYIDFPHAKQVLKIESRVTKLDGTRLRKTEVEVRFAVTSLSKSKANKTRLLHLARGHWSIENKVHYVRDVAYDEDRSQVRKGGAQAMASLRNIAMNLLRLAGAQNIQRATRHCMRHPEVAARLIGIDLAA